MEAAGVLFDVPRCNTAAVQAHQDAAALVSRWEAVAPGVNPESPVQLSSLLYVTRGFPVPPISGTLKAVRRTKRDEKPTSEAALDWLLRKSKSPETKELLDVLMQLRRTTKLAQFLDKLPTFCDDRGFLYAAFGPDTGTGRLSSRNPNLQNIPGAKNDKYGIRSCFIAPPGQQLLVADYSALEPRILGHWLVTLFGDRSLVDAIAAGDVYGAIAKQAWPKKLAGVDPKAMKHSADPAITRLRDYAKIVFLAKVYGKQIPSMALQMGTSVEEATAVDEDFGKAYPGVVAFQHAAMAEAMDTGGVKTLLGRTRLLDVGRSEYEMARAGRQATNTRVQGSAADVVFGAMIRQQGRGGTLQMQVHDELVWRLPLGQDPLPLIAAMEHPFRTPLHVPLDVDWKLCDNWSEGK